MYQLTHVSLISVLALLFGVVPAAVNPSSSSGNFLQQNTGTIIIVKDTVPDDPRDFAMQLRDASGTAVGGVVLDDDPSDGSVPRQNSRTVAAGTYTATEEAATGWIVTAITCEDPDSGSSGSTTNRTATIDLDPGETVTCTFTNEPDPNVPRGTLVIVKDAVPDDSQNFSFSIPGIDSLFQLDDDDRAPQAVGERAGHVLARGDVDVGHRAAVVTGRARLVPAARHGLGEGIAALW